MKTIIPLCRQTSIIEFHLIYHDQLHGMTTIRKASISRLLDKKKGESIRDLPSRCSTRKQCIGYLLHKHNPVTESAWEDKKGMSLEQFFFVQNKLTKKFPKHIRPHKFIRFVIKIAKSKCISSIEGSEKPH